MPQASPGPVADVHACLAIRGEPLEDQLAGERPRLGLPGVPAPEDVVRALDHHDVRLPATSPYRIEQQQQRHQRPLVGMVADPGQRAARTAWAAAGSATGSARTCTGTAATCSANWTARAAAVSGTDALVRATNHSRNRPGSDRTQRSATTSPGRTASSRFR